MNEAAVQDCDSCVVKKFSSTKALIGLVIALVMVVSGVVSALVAPQFALTNKDLSAMQDRVLEQKQQIEKLNNQSIQDAVELATIKVELRHLRTETAELKQGIKEMSTKIDLLLRKVQ